MNLNDSLNQIDDLIAKGLNAKDPRQELFEIGSIVREIRQEIAKSQEIDNGPEAA